MLLDSHHAQLYWADNIVEAGIDINSLQSEAEIFLYKKDILPISEVRLLIERANQLPFDKSLQVIVIEVATIPIEAQHALLKVLEEPPDTTRFVLVIKPGARLLPTVLSRCQVMVMQPPVCDDSMNDNEFAVFSGQTISDRLAVVADRAKKKDNQWFSDMADEFNRWLEINQSYQTKEILDYAIFLRQKGASKKMLWEALALTLPVVKL